MFRDASASRRLPRRAFAHASSAAACVLAGVSSRAASASASRRIEQTLLDVRAGGKQVRDSGSRFEFDRVAQAGDRIVSPARVKEHLPFHRRDQA